MPILGRGRIERMVRFPNTSSSCCEVKSAVILAAVGCESKGGNSTGRCVGGPAKGQHVGIICRARTDECPLSNSVRRSPPRQRLGICPSHLCRTRQFKWDVCGGVG